MFQDPETQMRNLEKLKCLATLAKDDMKAEMKLRDFISGLIVHCDKAMLFEITNIVIRFRGEELTSSGTSYGK